MANSEAEVTEQEVIQYDRQIRLWGLDAQKRLRGARVCAIGLESLGAEIVKNLVLAGVGAMTLVDDRTTFEKTLLMTDGTDFETRAHSSLARVQELNPNVNVSHAPGWTEDKDVEFFKDFTLVIICGVLCRSELLRITKILRQLEIKCIIGATFGLYGVGFNDFLAHEYAFENASGATEKAKIDYVPFYESIEYDEQKLTKRQKRRQNLQPLHIYQAAMDGSLKENAAKYSTLNEGCDWLAEAEGDVPPIGAIVGGILGQEAIKAIGLKEEPISNWFLFNGIHMRGNTIRL